MREIVSLHVPEVGSYPKFLERHLEKAMKFIYLRNIQASQEKKVEFAKHIILEFYYTHGDVLRIDDDLDLLINII